MPAVLRQHLAADLAFQAAGSPVVVAFFAFIARVGLGLGGARASVMRWLAAWACPSVQWA
jgi:hypothetical protein